MLIRNWKEVLKKSAVVWVGILGAILPEVPDLILKWLNSDMSAQVLSDGTKSYLRMILMALVIPAARVWQQRNMRPDNAPPLPEPTTTKGVLHE